MKTIYHLYDDSNEVEGMFTGAGELLDFWFNNDANWRSEYFNGFMKKLGIEVKEPPAKLQKAMLKKLRAEVEQL